MAKRDYVLGIDQQGGKGGGGSRSTSVVFSNLKHDAMRNRSLPNQHPISAITNLSGELSQRARYFVDLFDAPNLYTDYAGHAVVVNATEDGIEFGPNAVDMSDFFNGTFVESFNALVTSDGTTITMSLEQSGTGDLTMHFSDGDATLVCTPAATIELTAGTDTTPQSNYIYIPQSTGVLTKSTTGWPSVEHIKVSYFLVPSATFVQSDGTYVNQNWNDHRMGTDSQGHLSHMTMRMRRDGAYYFSGIDPNGIDQDSATSYFHRGASADIAYFKSSSGVIMQMHEHAVPVYDTSGTDTMLAVNWNGDAYHDFADLGDIVNDAEGVSLSNKYFNVAFFIVGNKGGEFAPLLVTLPSGGYASLSDAENDVDGYDNLSIPREFLLESSTGVAVCRMTLRWAGGTSTLTHESTSDMRMSTLSSGGGGGGGGVTDHGALTGLTDDDHPQYLLVDGTRAGSTSSAQDFGSNGVKVDNIVESTTDANVTISNHTIIGEGGNSQIASGTNTLLIDEVTTDVSGSVFGIQTGLELNPAASSAAYHYGNYYNVGVKSTNAQNFTGAVIGLQSQVDHEGTGLIDHAYGGRFFVVGGSTGTFDVAYGIQTLLALDDGNASKFHGVHISDVYTTGSGYVNDELVGLYIEAQTEFNIAGYGMYVEDGVAPNFIGNNTRFGYDETTAASLIYVKTTLATQDSFVIEKMTSQTGNLFQVINGGFYDYFTINPSGQIVLQGDTTRTISTTPGGGAEPTGPSINIVADSGYTGINESDPDATLDIGGNIKVQGGVPGTGKVLTATDSTGVATWETPDTIITDHGGLSGLGDDDHTQYALRSGMAGTPGYIPVFAGADGEIADSQMYNVLYGFGIIGPDPSSMQITSPVAGTLRIYASAGLATLQSAIVQTDTISELTAAAGVTIDGLLIKDGSIPESAVTEHEGAIDHTNIANIGTNTHAQIDTHLGSTSNPHSVTKAQVGLTNVPDLDTTDAVNNEHTHSNKTQLDLISDGDHDVRTDNPHSVTFSQVGGTLDHGDLSGLTTGDPHTQYLQTAGARAGATASRQAFNNGISSDTILELTSGVGVTIDGVNMLNSNVVLPHGNAVISPRNTSATNISILKIPSGTDNVQIGIPGSLHTNILSVVNSGNNEVFQVTGGGRVGVNMTPSYDLDITGTTTRLYNPGAVSLAAYMTNSAGSFYTTLSSTGAVTMSSPGALAMAGTSYALIQSGSANPIYLRPSNSIVYIDDTTAAAGSNVYLGNPSNDSYKRILLRSRHDSGGANDTSRSAWFILDSVGTLTIGNTITAQTGSAYTDQDIVFSTSGDAGIRIGGTYAAPAKLHVSGGDDNVVFEDATISLGYSTAGTFPHFIHTRHDAGVTNSAIDFYTNDGTGSGVFPTNAVHAMTMRNGAIGIGTVLPSANLHVEGTVLLDIGTPVNGQVLTTDATGLATWSYITPSTDSGNMLSSGTDNLPFVDDNIVFEQAGGNLYFNGSGGMEDNTNFEGFTYSGQYGYVGSGGFYTDTYNGTKFGTVDISVDPSKDYIMSAYMRAPVNVGQRYYFAAHALDADGYSINPYMGHPNTVVSGSTTTLAAKWTPGDLTMTVNDASGLDDSITYRSIVLGPYTNSYGYEYPEETYSRHSYPNNFTISGNVITFTSTPHANYWNPDEVDGSWPIGTKLWQSASGGTYIYPTDTVNFTLTGTDWQQVTGSITSDMWWHGQAYVHLGYLVNRTTSGGDVAISGARFEVAEGGGTIDGSGTVNYLAIWSDTDTLGDSVIVESGGKIGIGRTPSYTFDVDGTARVDALIIDSTGSVTNAPYWSLDGSYNLVLANPDYNTTIGGKTVHVIGEDAVSIQVDWDVSGAHVKLNVTDGTTANTMELAVYKDRVDIIKGSTIVARIDDSGNMEIAGDLTTNATIT